MSFLCWNCWGLEILQTIHELGDLIGSQDPTNVFIAKTLLEEARLPGVLKKLNFKNSPCVSRENQGGGLVLLWNSKLDVCVEMSTLNHIDAIINKGKADAWGFTWCYRAPKKHNHFESWNLLRSLRLRLFWLQTDSENAFPKKWMFGCYWKFGQTENVFNLTIK